MMKLSRWKVTATLLSVIFGILFSLPNVLPQSTLDALPGVFPKQKLNLGLDLQGGSSLLLEVDTNALRAEKLTNLIEDVRKTLREEQIPFTDLATVDGEVSVRITDPGQLGQAANLLRKAVGTALPGAAGGRDVNLSTPGDQRIRIAFVPEALNTEASAAVAQC